MKRYYVIAVKWSEEHNQQIRYIAGEFTEYICAKLFRDAYNEHYSADAEIVDNFKLLN